MGKLITYRPNATRKARERQEEHEMIMYAAKRATRRARKITKQAEAVIGKIETFAPNGCTPPF